MAFYYYYFILNFTQKKGNLKRDNKCICAITDYFRFLCTYDLQWYPFDIQNCQLQLTMFGKSGDFSTLGKYFNYF